MWRLLLLVVALTLVVAPGCAGEPEEDLAPAEPVAEVALQALAEQLRSERVPLEGEFLLGGVQVNEPSIEAWHSALEQDGFNTVHLTVYARHQAWDGPELTFDEDPSWLIPEIRAAKTRGIRVALVLRVALEHGLDENRFYWHGMIFPRTDAQVREWFENYGRFVMLWAEVAKTEGVDVFGLGSELNALASSTQVETLPELEEYFLNQGKQVGEDERARDAAGRAGEDALEGRLKAGWGETYDSLDRYLDERTAANVRWARQVTYNGDLVPYNQRRLLLQQQWYQLIALGSGKQ